MTESATIMPAHARVPAQLRADLPSMIADAASRLAAARNVAELLDARVEADTVRGIAKQAARLARRKGHLDAVVHAANRAQVDAMKIEAEAMVRLADETDAAIERGELRKHGQRGKAANGQAGDGEDIADGTGLPPTLAEAGLNQTEIYEARRIRDAELAEPGIVARALEARFDQGHVPGRKFLRDAIVRNKRGTAGGNERSAIAADPDDANLYQTPWVAGAVLARLLKFDTFWEPCCGPGALATALEAEGKTCAFASDLHDYSVNDDGEVNPFWERVQPALGSFLDVSPDIDRIAPDGVPIDAIITNPPYNNHLPDKMMATALDHAQQHGIRRLAFLQRLNFIAGSGERRCASLDKVKPERIIVFSRRLPMMHREDFKFEGGSSSMDMAWFVWDIEQPDGPTTVERVDWARCLNLTDEQTKAVRDGAAREAVGI
ncbi:MAG: hypothetical protein AAF737_04885 [Pseudomonadota bacterium]